MTTGEPDLGRVLMVVPTYNEAENLEWIVGRLREAQPERRRPRRRRRLARRHRRPRRRAGGGRPGRPRAAPRARRPVWARRTSPASPGRSRPATTSSARWTRTARTSPSSWTACWPRWPAPTWSSGPAGSRAGRSSTGPCGASCCPAGATSTSGCCSGSRSATPPPASGSSAAPRWRRSTSASVRSTGYVFQTDLVTRCLRAGLVVREVPIEFVERVRGDSKMSGAVATESLRRITSWGLRERRDQLRRASPRPRTR